MQNSTLIIPMYQPASDCLLQLTFPVHLRASSVLHKTCFPHGSSGRCIYLDFTFMFYEVAVGDATLGKKFRFKLLKASGTIRQSIIRLFFFKLLRDAVWPEITVMQFGLEATGCMQMIKKPCISLYTCCCITCRCTNPYDDIF